MSQLQLHRRVVWKTSQTDAQICVWCGELMSKGERAVSLKNKPGSSLSITKNLWVHAECTEELGEYLQNIHELED